jgi:hypothetical protein
MMAHKQDVSRNPATCAILRPHDHAGPQLSDEDGASRRGDAVTRRQANASGYLLVYVNLGDLSGDYLKRCSTVTPTPGRVQAVGTWGQVKVEVTRVVGFGFPGAVVDWRGGG